MMTPLLIFMLCYALSRLVPAIKGNDWVQGVIWAVCCIALLLVGGPVTLR